MHFDLFKKLKGFPKSRIHMIESGLDLTLKDSYGFNLLDIGSVDHGSSEVSNALFKAGFKAGKKTLRFDVP